MPALSIALFLILLVLLVHFWTGSSELNREAPLDVDGNLPLPWASHGSSMFSLNALFGAYLSIAIAKGVVALIGLALGSVIGLILIKHVMVRLNGSSFEKHVLARPLAADKAHNRTVWRFMAITQLGFATSELLILYHISNASLGMDSSSALVFTVSVALIAYFYCLIGGYEGMFRADIIQFVAVISMAVVLFAIAVPRVIQHPGLVNASLFPSSTNAFWRPQFGLSQPIGMTLDACLGVVMGYCFVVAGPDTWKRVYVHLRQSPNNRWSFSTFVAAGLMPFIIILPAIVAFAGSNQAFRNPAGVFLNATTSSFTLAVVCVGLIASFMSSFDSSLLTTVHIILAHRHDAENGDPREEIGNTLTNLDRFHFSIGTALVIVLLVLFSLASTIGNLYILAILLIGPYAILGGLLTAGVGVNRKLHGAPVVVIGSIALVGWFIYVVSDNTRINEISLELIHTIPAGVILFLLSLTVSRFFSKT